MKEDIKKVLILGSGALKIGEAGEFRLFRQSGIESHQGRGHPDGAYQPEHCNGTDFGRGVRTRFISCPSLLSLWKR